MDNLSLYNSIIHSFNRSLKSPCLQAIYYDEHIMGSVSTIILKSKTKNDSCLHEFWMKSITKNGNYCLHRIH